MQAENLICKMLPVWENLSCMKKVIILFCLAAMATIYAQEVHTITVRGSGTPNIAVSPLGGADGATATQVLTRDLELSGWFSLGSAASANFTASGTASGGTLRGKLTDANGAPLLEKTYTGNARRAAHLFADDIVSTITGQHGIAASKIAFVSTRSGRKEIYTADYDGANVVQVTRDGAISVAPALSPNGRRLAYTGYHGGYADIYLIDLDSGARRPLVKFPGTNSGASFSPDGGRIACTVSRDGNPELYVVGLSGGARRLTKTPGVESSPSWSPDGSEIVYSNDDSGSPQLFRIPSSGGQRKHIPTGYGYCTEPCWSPDGKKIAFTTRSGGFSIAVKDLQTGATKIHASGENPVWGANSRHVIYSTGSSLILLDTQTGRPTPIITGLGKVTEPTWSR